MLGMHVLALGFFMFAAVELHNGHHTAFVWYGLFGLVQVILGYFAR